MADSNGGALSHPYPLAQLSGAEPLADFRDSVTRTLDIDFPNDYWDRAHCLALMGDDDQFWGGAMVIAQPPFRSLDSIPNSHSADIERRMDDLQSRVAEVNGLWLATGKRTQLISFTFWCQLAEHLLELPIDHFIFTFDPQNGPMVMLQNWLSADVLYSGTTLQLPGMRSPQRETIALVSHEAIARFHALLAGRQGAAQLQSA